MKERFNNGVQKVEELRLSPGVTSEIQQAVADEADSFDESEYTSEGEKAIAALILVSTNDARIAYGADPVSGGLGYPQVQGSEIILNSTAEIENFRWINETATEQVTLTVTFYYRN